MAERDILSEWSWARDQYRSDGELRALGDRLASELKRTRAELQEMKRRHGPAKRIEVM